MTAKNNRGKDLPLSATLLREVMAHRDLDDAGLAAAINVSESQVRKAKNGIHVVNVYTGLAAVYPDDQDVKAVLAAKEAEQSPVPHTAELLIPPELLQGLAEAQINRFFASRDFYRRFRDGRATISQYVESARTSLEMVSITLVTGNEVEGLMDTFERMLTRQSPPTIRVSLLDPDNEHLMHAIAPVIQSSPETLASRIRDACSAIEDLHSRRLPPRRRDRLELWNHQCLPNASAIIINGDDEDGTVQLETKGYKTGMDKSWGFEVLNGSDFYFTLRESYRHLVGDGRRLL